MSSRLSRTNIIVKEFFLPYTNKNHDGLAFSSTNFIVLDGATPLRPEDEEDLKPWVDYIAKSILEHSDNADNTLSESWKQGMLSANLLYEPKGVFRSAGITHVRLNCRKLEYLIAGDVKLFIKHKDSTYIEIFDDRLDYHEKIADAMIEKGEITPMEAAIINRNKVNSPRGYYVLSDDPRMPSKAVYGEIELLGLESFIVASDGVWRLISTPEEAFKVLEEDYLEEWLLDLQGNLKIKDDFTLLKVDLN
jgi:hypothetical protein